MFEAAIAFLFVWFVSLSVCLLLYISISLPVCLSCLDSLIDFFSKPLLRLLGSPAFYIGFFKLFPVD